MKSFNTVFKSVFLKQTSIYFATNIINAIIPFALLPTMTMYLTPSAFGIISIFGVVSSVFLIATNLNLHGAIERQYYKKETNLSCYIGTCTIMVFIMTVFVTCFTAIFSDQFSFLINIPREWLLLAVVNSFFTFFTLVVLTLFRLDEKPGLYAFLQIFQGLIGAVLAVVLVVTFASGWQGRLFAILWANICTGLIAIWILLKKGRLKISLKREYAYNALRFGLPLIPYALSSMIMNMMDKIIISSMLGVSTTGIYTVGAQFAMIIAFITSSFNSVWVGWFYKQLVNDDFKAKVLIVKITYIYFATIILLCFGLAIIAPYILQLMVNSSFYGAVDYIFWIGLGYAINGMYMMVGNYLFFVERTSILAYISIISAIINIFLTYVFVNYNGAVGAAQAIVVSNAVFFALAWYFASRLYPIPWFLWRKNASNC